MFFLLVFKGIPFPLTEYCLFLLPLQAVIFTKCGYSQHSFYCFCVKVACKQESLVDIHSCVVKAAENQLRKSSSPRS